jgi:hypothetical protein
MAINIMRKAQGPLAAREIAGAIMKAKGFVMRDDRLCSTATDMQLAASRTLRSARTSLRVRASRNAQGSVLPSLV